MDAALSLQTLAWSVLHRPEILRAGRFPVLERNRGFVHRWPSVALHQHDYEGLVHIGTGQYELRPGDLTLTPAEIDSHYHLPRDGFHLCIHFRSAEEAVAEQHALNLPLHLRLGTGSQSVRQRIVWITDLHRRAQHADARKRDLALAAASAGMQELLLTLALLEPEEPSVAEPVSSRVEKAMLALLEQIDLRLKEALAIPDLAEASGLSQNYLARAFRRRYGMPVPHFILQRRVELARHLLLTSELTIKQIGQEVGLPDVQHFNKQFRRLAGMSPSAYRRQERTKGNG